MKNKQPNSRHCFVCGIENRFGLHLKFYDTAPGEVTTECILPAEYQSYPGIVHGGIIAAMLDEAAGRSQMGGIDEPRFMFTARLQIHYRKNVPVEQKLRLVGRAGVVKARTAAATSVIYDQNGVLLAEAEVILVNVPNVMLASVDLEFLGWKVYPDLEMETP